MSVLVTGGAGFVGAYVVRDLLRAKERVLVYDIAPKGNALDLVLRDGARTDSLRVESGSVTDSWRLQRLCEDEKVDRIVHLASPLTQDVLLDPIGGIRDICEGTAGIFEVARVLGAKRVAWASSVAVFGSRRHYPDGPIANDAPHRPENLYGSCKSLCERMALDYRETYGVDNVALRLSVVYGPARLRGYMTFPSDIIRSAALGLPVKIPISQQAVHWQYVEEVSAMFVAALAREQTPTVAYNTCGDVATFARAAKLLAALAPNVEMTVSEEASEVAQEALRQAPFEYDDSAFRQAFGYQMQFPLERGLELSYAEFQHMAEAKPLAESPLVTV